MIATTDLRRRAVQALYAGIRERDADTVAAIVDDHFADDVVLHEPSSLPWGGAHAGRERVRRMFVGMAAAPAGQSPIAAASLRVQRVAADGDDVVVDLRFDLTLEGVTQPRGAVEWFSWRDGKVVEIRATYIDPPV